MGIKKGFIVQREAGYWVRKSSSRRRLIESAKLLEAPRPQVKARSRLDSEALVRAVEKVTGLKRIEFCNARKIREFVLVKEVMIIVGRECGASTAELARLLGLDGSVVSRRYESGKAKLRESEKTRLLVKRVREELKGKK